MRIGLTKDQEYFRTLKDKHTLAILVHLEAPEGVERDMLYNDVEDAEDKLTHFINSRSENVNANSVEKCLLDLSNVHKRSINSRNTTRLEFHLLISDNGNEQ